MTDDRITGAEAQALLDALLKGEDPEGAAYKLDAAAPRLARAAVNLEKDLRRTQEALVWVMRSWKHAPEIPDHFDATLAAARAQQEKADE